MDKNGNVINDNNEDEADTLEITGVDQNENNANSTNSNYNTMEITGVSENDAPITGVSENDTPTEYTKPPEITGVAGNLEHTETETETETENDIAQDTNYEQNNMGQYHNTYHEQDDDDVSIENEIPEDIQVTINDMNTVHEMNAGQLNVDPDTGEEIEEESEEPRHRYNLRPRPTKRNQKYNMTNIGQQSTIAKPHLHVMLNQVGIRERLQYVWRRRQQCTTEGIKSATRKRRITAKKERGHDARRKKKSTEVFNVSKRKKGWNHQGKRMR